MTHLAVGFGRGFPRIWLLPIGALTLILGVAVVGRLPRSIAADLLAWWPVWIGLAVSAYFFRDRKVGQIRVAGLIPIVALAFVGLFLWGHLAGWSIMPSAAQRLVGPDADGFTQASLEARIDGEIDLSGGSEFLYQVEPVMSGGAVGIPGAAEQVVDSSVSVILEAPPDPGLYTYAGWEVSLAEAPQWSLTLDGAVDADLTSLEVEDVSVVGRGVLRLGEANEEAPVTVDGVFRLILPPDTPARVNGTASVPASWTLDARGASSPTLGAGWVITVGPEASVTVAEG
jgi:hypothetical protein